MSTLNRPRVTKATLALVVAFGKIGPLWGRWVYGRIRKSGLSFARLKLLGTLDLMGPQIMNELSEQLGVTPRNITALVDALEAEGLVKRRPHPTDRRATVIEMTPLGASSSCGARGEFDHAALELFGQLSVADQQAFRVLLEKMHAILIRETAREATGSPEPHPVAPQVKRTKDKARP